MAIGQVLNGFKPNVGHCCFRVFVDIEALTSKVILRDHCLLRIFFAGRGFLPRQRQLGIPTEVGNCKTTVGNYRVPLRVFLLGRMVEILGHHALEALGTCECEKANDICCFG